MIEVSEHGDVAVLSMLALFDHPRSVVAAVNGHALARARALAVAPPDVYALAERQLHAPAHERIAARRELDDPDVAALRRGPSTQERLSGFLSGLAAR